LNLFIKHVHEKKEKGFAKNWAEERRDQTPTDASYEKNFLMVH
jgi:hypothetical protein